MTVRGENSLSDLGSERVKFPWSSFFFFGWEESIRGNSGLGWTDGGIQSNWPNPWNEILVLNPFAQAVSWILISSINSWALSFYLVEWEQLWLFFSSFLCLTGVKDLWYLHVSPGIWRTANFKAEVIFFSATNYCSSKYSIEGEDLRL